MDKNTFELKSSTNHNEKEEKRKIINQLYLAINDYNLKKITDTVKSNTNFNLHYYIGLLFISGLCMSLFYQNNKWIIFTGIFIVIINIIFAMIWYFERAQHYGLSCSIEGNQKYITKNYNQYCDRLELYTETNQREEVPNNILQLLLMASNEDIREKIKQLVMENNLTVAKLNYVLRKNEGYYRLTLLEQ